MHHINELELTDIVSAQTILKCLTFPSAHELRTGEI
jgi:hypothetical protein